MWEGVITTRVKVPHWTQREIAAVDAAERVAIWREADRRPEDGPRPRSAFFTDSDHVSLEVKASDDAEARTLVRAALGGLMELEVDDFGPSAYR